MGSGDVGHGLVPVFACTFLQRARGLIARPHSWLASDEALVLVPCSSIHTFGMRHAIDVAFLDKRGFVLAARKSMPPWQCMSCAGAVAVLERFASPLGERGRIPPWPELGCRIALGSTGRLL